MTRDRILARGSLDLEDRGAAEAPQGSCALGDLSGFGRGGAPPVAGRALRGGIRAISGAVTIPPAGSVNTQEGFRWLPGRVLRAAI
jgi:hypothetical protein